MTKKMNDAVAGYGTRIPRLALLAAPAALSLATIDALLREHIIKQVKLDQGERFPIVFSPTTDTADYLSFLGLVSDVIEYDFIGPVEAKGRYPLFGVRVIAYDGTIGLGAHKDMQLAMVFAIAGALGISDNERWPKEF